MGGYWNIDKILLIIVNVSKCFSISIEAPGNAVQGKEYTLRCADSSRQVIWFKKRITTAWSIDTFINDKPSNKPGCYFHNISDTSLYEFKDCGVKHELTIKSLDYNRDNGVDWSCQSSEGGKMATLTLLVKDQPRLGLRVQEDNGKLLCIIVDRSENMIFLPWKHSIDDQLVREIEGYYINTTVYSLNITNSQNNGGNYTCTVNNGISDPNTKQPSQKANYNLDLKVQPTLYNVESNNNLVARQNGTFSLKYLEDKPVNVSWHRNDTDLQTSDRITIREEPTEISHPNNNNIKLSGIKTILTITSITITDQGIYTCQVCNQYGCSNETFQLDLVIEKRMEADEEGNMDTTILGISIGLTALFICIIVIVIFIVCKRKTKSNGGSPLPVITENELYVSSDMVIEQPHSSDTVPVQKPVEMEIIENDLYISSDLVVDGNKIQDPPIYGQINKVTTKNKIRDNKSSIG